MSIERRKPGWPFWIAFTLIVVPILYVASFGPACWLYWRGLFPNEQLYLEAYWPIGELEERSAHGWMSELIWEYASLGCPATARVVIPFRYGPAHYGKTAWSYNDRVYGAD